MKRSYWARANIALLILASLSGCGASEEEEPVWRPVAATTSASVALPLQSSPLPTAASCFNDAAFLEDLTLPDGSKVNPGEMLDKRWSVLNDGSCDWGPAYRLVRIGEDQLAGVAQQALYPARAGAQAIWQVYLMAPTEPGRYESRWQAMSPEGVLFGDPVFVVVVVPPSENAAPAATRIATPTVSSSP